MRNGKLLDLHTLPSVSVQLYTSSFAGHVSVCQICMDILNSVRKVRYLVLCLSQN
jgi:hypothetical protein